MEVIDNNNNIQVTEEEEKNINWQDFINSYSTKDDIPIIAQIKEAITFNDPTKIYEFIIDYRYIDKEIKKFILSLGDFNILSKIFSDEIKTVIFKENRKLYEEIRDVNIKVRLKNFLYDWDKNDFPNLIPIRSINSSMMDKFLCFRGIIRNIVTNQNNIRKQKFKCLNCNNIMVLDFNDLDRSFDGKTCTNTDCNSENLEMVKTKGGTTNVQVLTIEELANDSEKDTDSVTVTIDGNLVNQFSLGDTVIVTGNYRLDVYNDTVVNQFKKKTTDMKYYKHLSIYGGPTNGLFANSFIEANFIEKISDNNIMFNNISKEELKEIKRLSTDHKLTEKFVQSFAPDIFGYDMEKEVLIYQLIGGAGRSIDPELNKRGEIHVFFIGDSGCLVEGTKVILSNGQIIPLEEFKHFDLNKYKTKVYTGQQNEKGWGRGVGIVKNFFKFEKKPVIEVILESGKRVTGTYEHPLRTYNKEKREYEWKRLDQLKVGDKLKVTTKIDCTLKNEIPTRFNKNYRSRLDVKIPEFVNEDLAAFMGYIIGDGSIVSDKAIRYSIQQNELEFLESKLNKICYNLFGLDTHKEIRYNKSKIFNGRLINPKNNSYNYYLYSKPLVENLLFLLNRRVPDLIFKSPDRIVSTFLKWLYQADGSVFNNGRGRRGISYSSVDLDLLLDIQLILLRFGIHSRIVDKTLHIRRGESIKKFYKYIGFIDDNKNRKLKELAEDSEEFERFGKQIFEEIVSIEYKKEPQDVYDIEVEKYHSFIANGIVSHNTAKSELMMWSLGIAHRCRFIYAGNMTKVGMSGGAEQDATTGKWVLSAGSAVVADRGLLGIDELNHAPPDILKILNEIMEKQTTTITKIKSGSFNTRVAVLACANPPDGNRYNKNRTFIQNLGINISLFTRFDYIGLFRDIPNPERDPLIAQKIIKSYQKANIPIIRRELLAKYIFYAKNQTKEITFTKDAEEEIERYYTKIRTHDFNENIKNPTEQERVSITARQIETLLRFAVSRARFHLRTVVDRDDVERAEKIIDEQLKKIGVDPETGQIDASILNGAKPRSEMSRDNIFFDLLEKMAKSYDNQVSSQLFYMELRKEKQWSKEDYDDQKLERYMKKLEKQQNIIVVNDKISLTNFNVSNPRKD